VCAYMCTGHVCTYIRMCTCVHRAHMYIYMYVHICMYIHSVIYMYIRIVKVLQGCFVSALFACM